ncbi:MAG TPA: hypothetical protein VMA72_03030 [Streptosporangiaceae bacterium]|nr:hypothetical protein [Streptosporangiaceae bacterium]
MSRTDERRRWRNLEADAEAEASKHPLTPAQRDQIREALDRARKNLGGEDVRSHRVGFDVDKWPDVLALPAPALESKHLSRGDGFDIAREAVTSATNWQLFCMSFVFGYGMYGVGPTRLQRILKRTAQQQLCDVIGEARKRLHHDGPLSSYDYLRGSDTHRTVPFWGPAFFTKLLYFAAGESGGALILDNQTAWIVARLSSMNHLVSTRGRSECWTVWRYAVYLAWIRMVATQLQVQPDFLEYALFSEAKRRRRRPRLRRTGLAT